MFGRYVVDQFLNQDCFTYACTAEQTDLTAFCVWADQSTTLMPVSKISAAGDWSLKAGAGR